ncbi:vWA domain-containing protein [Spirillospora sp. CA-294931]|uniref:vWA domain-containing protein n=1 Tax=Spirillospora sp. CA-294931 TaxID=3240042 RepID=UPI003D8F488C
MPTQLSKGGNAPLTTATVTIEVSAPAPIDVSAALLNADRKVRGDDDLVFFNHPAQDGVTLHGQTITADLTRVPPSVDLIAVVASVDGLGRTFDAGTTPKATITGDLAFDAPPLTNGETVVVLLELYRRAGTWKIRAVGQGYASGLAGLATDFGVDVDDDPAPSRAAISLDKVQATAPALVDLYKHAGVSLDKHGLTGLRAAVYLVLDRSGSMSGYYRNGSVQHLAEQTLGLCAHLDDDGVVPIIFFDTNAHDPIDVSLTGYQGRVADEHRRLRRMGTTNYAAAMEAVIDHYRSSGANAPAFVIFQTDGAPDSRRDAERVLCRSSVLPIFWQFIGFGKGDFQFLRKLDELPVPAKRAVDNAGFFAAGKKPKELDDAVLYDRLLAEFPQWLHAARAQGIVR